MVDAGYDFSFSRVVVMTLEVKYELRAGSITSIYYEG